MPRRASYLGIRIGRLTALQSCELERVYVITTSFVRRAHILTECGGELSPGHHMLCCSTSLVHVCSEYAHADGTGGYVRRTPQMVVRPHWPEEKRTINAGHVLPYFGPRC